MVKWNSKRYKLMDGYYLSSIELTKFSFHEQKLRPFEIFICLDLYKKIANKTHLTQLGLF